jgi:hypothetical protein
MIRAPRIDLASSEKTTTNYSTVLTALVKRVVVQAQEVKAMF